MLNLLAIPSVIALGGMNVALVDLIVLAVLLIALIIGLSKGFVKQIFSLFGGIAALVVAIFTCSHIAEFITTSIPAIPEAISVKVDTLFGLDGVLFEGSKEQIIGSLSSTSIPSFLHPTIADLIISKAGELQLTQIITGWAVTAIAFVSAFIISLILFKILKKIFKAITSGGAIGAIDKVLGMIFSIAVALIICLVICILLYLIIPNVNDYLVPVTETGESVKCYFNDLMTWVLSLDFVSSLLIPA